jgi:hypothetical protein
MTDPLTTQSHTEALEELLAAADALLVTARKPDCWHTNTTVSIEAAADLRRAVASARAALDAEQAA